MENQQERPKISIDWFAGFFEAEGWFSLMETNIKYKEGKIKRYVPTAGICNTDFYILQCIEEMFKVNEIEYQLHIRQPRKKGYKKGWQIHMSGFKRVIAFIDWILPYLMSLKKWKAEKLLEFSKLRREKTQGFCGVGYSAYELNLYGNICFGIPNDYTPNAER